MSVDTLTGRELIKALMELPAESLDSVVVLQKDAEGNGYSPAAGAEMARYAAETTYSGNVVSDDEDPEYVP